MGFRVDMLGRRIGAEITGWDARDAIQSEIDEMKVLLASHGVLALREQDLRPAQFKAFAEKFGPIEFAVRDAYRLPLISAGRRNFRSNTPRKCSKWTTATEPETLRIASGRRAGSIDGVSSPGRRRG